MKYFLYLFLLISFNLFSQENSNQVLKPLDKVDKVDKIDVSDNQVIGIIKLYKAGDNVEIRITYADTTIFQHPVQLFDLVAKTYISIFPFYNPQEMFEVIRNNVEKYYNFYWPKKEGNE